MFKTCVRRVVIAGLACVAFIANSPSAHAESPWWNPAWDSSVRFVWNKGLQYDDLKTDPSNGRDMAAVRAFVLGNALETDGAEDFWAWFATVENCAKGLGAVDDLHNEFGDRARGGVALDAARARLRAWAASKNRILSLYFPAVLGPYDQQTQSFPAANVAPPTTDPARIKFGPSTASLFGIGQLITNGPRATPSAVWGQRNAAVCPDGPNRYKAYQSAWTIILKFGATPRYGGDPTLQFPAIKMDQVVAQQFVTKHPLRAVVYEVQLRLSAQPGSFDDDTKTFVRRADVVRMIARDDTGNIVGGT